MESAFGVDHGYEEFEKLGLGGITKPVTALGGALAGKGAGLVRSGASQRNAARGVLRGQGFSGSSPIKAMRGNQVAANAKGNMMGAGLRMKTGAAMGKVGGFMQRRPGATLGIAGGGAAAGAGGFGLSRRRQ